MVRKHKVIKNPDFTMPGEELSVTTVKVGRFGCSFTRKLLFTKKVIFAIILSLTVS